MLTLRKRFDPAAHANRWYLVTVQPTLRHATAVICTWGSRENDYQRLKILPEATAVASPLIWV